jgi:hypothetical protein
MRKRGRRRGEKVRGDRVKILVRVGFFGAVLFVVVKLGAVAGFGEGLGFGGAGFFADAGVLAEGA